MKKIVLIFLFFHLANFTRAQDSLRSPETVIVRIFEGYSGVGADESDCFIITTTPEGNNERKELELVHIGTKGTYQQMLHNQTKIKTEITRWNNQGFSVKGSTQILIGVIAVTTIILEK